MSSRPALRARIAAIDRNLGQLADQVARLESQISSLRAEKIDLKRELSGLVYPILTLPTEITFEILVQTVAVANPFAVLKCPSPYYALALASVCGAWRDVALSSCALWNQITLDCRYTSDPVSIFNCWASRSGTLPLDICVRFGADDNAIRIAESLFAVMSRFAPRWRTLSLRPELTLGSNQNLRLPWVFENLENLRSLSMTSRIHWLNQDPQSATGAPALEEISLFFTSLPTRMLNSRALQRLKILHLNTTPPLETIRILRLTPVLEVLHLCESTPEGLTHGVEPLVLPALRSLTCEGDAAFSILRCLSLPALQYLQMSGVSERGGQVLDLIEPFIMRSQCRIDHLSLRNTYYADSENMLSACLDLFSHIRTLTLEVDAISGWRPQTFTNLVRYARSHAGGNHHNSPLANLETLILRGPTIQTDFTELVEWVQERSRETPRKLRRLEIHFQDRFEVSPAVCELVSVGVDVEMGTVSSRELAFTDPGFYLD
ncbi:hypothetical protein C8F01DRAFT_1064881 [Mycena amicta]|nr:hypothetical protein C8F01DRAFT_1064881 [Mycena amicta]